MVGLVAEKGCYHYISMFAAAVHSSIDHEYACVNASALFSSICVWGCITFIAPNIAFTIIPIVCALLHKSLVGLVLLIVVFPVLVYFSLFSCEVLVVLRNEPAGAPKVLTFSLFLFPFYSFRR